MKDCKHVLWWWLTWGSVIFVASMGTGYIASCMGLEVFAYLLGWVGSIGALMVIASPAIWFFAAMGRGMSRLVDNINNINKP